MTSGHSFRALNFSTRSSKRKKFVLPEEYSILRTLFFYKSILVFKMHLAQKALNSETLTYNY